MHAILKETRDRKLS